MNYETPHWVAQVHPGLPLNQLEALVQDIEER